MTCAAAAHLGITLSSGALPVCESCAMAKAYQLNILKDVSNNNKVLELNGTVFHNISKIKVPDEFKGITIAKSNWHLMVDEASKFKRSKVFETKGGMIPNLPKYMHAEEKQGYLIKILR